MIKPGDIVFHELSALFFRCENSKQASWMNENKYYKLVHLSAEPYDLTPILKK